MSKEGKRLKILYTDFLINDLEKGDKSIMRLWNKIKDICISKINQFEKDNNFEIQILFDKTNTQLSLFHYSPDNRETQEKCLNFVSDLNGYLDQHLRNRPLI